jgi:hypothetical protein
MLIGGRNFIAVEGKRPRSRFRQEVLPCPWRQSSEALQRQVPAAHRRDLDDIAGMRRVDELAPADVDPVVPQPVEEDEVAGFWVPTPTPSRLRCATKAASGPTSAPGTSWTRKPDAESRSCSPSWTRSSSGQRARGRASACASTFPPTCRGGIYPARELPYRRRPPTKVDEYQPLIDEILTTSPVCGEWMNCPPPM